MNWRELAGIAEEEIPVPDPTRVDKISSNGIPSSDQEAPPDAAADVSEPSTQPMDICPEEEKAPGRGAVCLPHQSTRTESLLYPGSLLFCDRENRAEGCDGWRCDSLTHACVCPLKLKYGLGRRREWR